MIYKILFISFLIVITMVAIALIHKGYAALYVLIISCVIALLFLIRLKYYLTKDYNKSWVYLMLSWIFFYGVPFAILSIVIINFANFNLQSILFTLSLTGLTYTFFYDFVHIPLAIYHKLKEQKADILFMPKVTFIVPAYNEEKGIARTIESLLDVDYKKREIIVVNDGSTDRTAEIVKKYEKQGVKVISKPNTGKASSINYGSSYANGEIIITVDADSLVNKYAVTSVIRRFQDKNVMAVCGNVKVLNRVNILTKLQTLEYITDINLAKRAFDIFGSTLVVPGVFGAYRKSALQASGKMDVDTITEDFDTTMKSLKAGGVVQATSFALSFTEAPETIKDLYKQRLRWYEGTFQTLIKHRDIISNPRFGMTAEIGFPYLLMSIMFMPIVSFVSLAILVYLSFTEYFPNVVTLIGMFIFLESLLSLFSITVDEEDWQLIIYAPLFVIGYRQFRDFVKLKAFYNVIFRRSGGWRTVKRMGRADELLRKLDGRRK